MKLLHFNRNKYRINVTDREYYEKWVELNPILSQHIDFQKFKRYLRLFREEFFKEILINPSGIELDHQMGNISIRILDIDFKCEKDFEKVLSTEKREYEYRITSNMPKRAKITWKKHIKFKRIPSLMGMDPARAFKKAVGGKNIADNMNIYKKAYRVDKVQSKCPPVTEKSIFDIV